MQAPQFRFRICSSSQKIHLINLQSLSFLIASPKQPLFLSLSLHSPFWTFHKNGIYTVQDCIYLLLLNMVFELLPCCCMCQHFILFHCLTVSILWLARFTAATYPIMNRIGPDFCICECCCCDICMQAHVGCTLSFLMGRVLALQLVGHMLRMCSTLKKQI